jgi:hypothetical protein
MTIRGVAQVDASVVEAFHRAGDPQQLIKVLRKSVNKRAKPVLAEVRGRTPVRTGQLQQSLGITMKTDAGNGEIYALIGVRDNVTINVDGKKMLATSLRPQRAAKIAAHRGLDTATNRTAFKYVFGIETGRKRGGGLARAAGGARMLSGGLNANVRPYVDGVGADILAFIRKNQTEP